MITFGIRHPYQKIDPKKLVSDFMITHPGV
jgi:hypothetical protein